MNRRRTNDSVEFDGVECHRENGDWVLSYFHAKAAQAARHIMDGETNSGLMIHCIAPSGSFSLSYPIFSYHYPIRNPLMVTIHEVLKFNSVLFSPLAHALWVRRDTTDLLIRSLSAPQQPT
jgi:hypothetical protein